jgi:cytochrome c oxidase subunit 4
MSTVTEQHNTEHHDSGHSDAEHHGASDKQYIMIALLLAFLTAIEVSTYYVDFGPLFLPTLFVLMIIKFVIVVSYFMHLKFDNKMFSYMFYSGLILAIMVYAGALSTFKFFLQKG